MQRVGRVYTNRDKLHTSQDVLYRRGGLEKLP